MNTSLKLEGMNTSLKLEGMNTSLKLEGIYNSLKLEFMNTSLKLWRDEHVSETRRYEQPLKKKPAYKWFKYLKRKLSFKKNLKIKPLLNISYSWDFYNKIRQKYLQDVLKGNINSAVQLFFWKHEFYRKKTCLFCRFS